MNAKMGDNMLNYEDMHMSHNSLFTTFDPLDDELNLTMSQMVDNDPWIGNALNDNKYLNDASIHLFDEDLFDDDLATGLFTLKSCSFCLIKSYIQLTLILFY